MNRIIDLKRKDFRDAQALAKRQQKEDEAIFVRIVD